MSHWRERAARAIRPIVEANPMLDEPALRKLIRAAYPFGVREHHPYKIWLSEVKAQLRAAGIRKRMKQAPPIGLFAPASPDNP